MIPVEPWVRWPLFMIETSPDSGPAVRLTPAQKWHTAICLYWSARNLKAAALRHQHPDWPPEKVEAAVREIFMMSPSLNR